ncbi:MAG: alpha/beta hydrolase [Actinomycetota bacterium]|nr:alpha/beta hydrolase [Actinomycetota bacterium]
MIARLLPVSWTWTLLAVLTVACLLAGPARASASATPAQAGKPKIAWRPCNEQFQCATVRVPLDYDRHSSGTISIALARLPATDPSRRIGSLFLNPGGPGGSGVDYLLGAGPFLYTDEVRARFDLVGFDPRGIIRSTPLRCFNSPDEWEPFFTPFAFPMTREEERARIAADRYLLRACDRRGGRIIDHMSTANAARDLDVLRAAVGDRRLTYAGVSYGSYLGVTYANLFPNRVRALVVDGVLDPIAWSTGRGGEARRVPFSTRLRSDAGAQATLGEFFRLCDAGGDACAFSGHAADRFAALAKRVRAEPVVLTFEDGSTAVLDYSNLIGITLGSMYDSASWSDFALFLADVESQAAPVRVGARLQRLYQRTRPAYAPTRGMRERITTDYENFLEGFPGVACSDSDNPDDYAAWSIAGAKADAEFGYFGRIWTWASSICAEWRGFDRDRYMGPFNRVTANPILVVGNTFDPATRYEGAQIVHRLMPRSSLLTVHGWGHTSLFLSQCADAAIARYLIDEATPPPGATCEQDAVPFAGG